MTPSNTSTTTQKPWVYTPKPGECCGAYDSDVCGACPRKGSK